MRWEEEETLLTDIAYFNSLLCKTTIRLYSQQVVNQSQYAKRAEPRLVRWSELKLKKPTSHPQNSGGRWPGGSECRVPSPIEISQLCALLTSLRVFQGLLR
jgi:hypothetical protein